MNTDVRKLFAPIAKNTTGSITAILSDTSIDLDGEIIGKKFLQKAADSELIRGLVDHENKALNTVCEWVNKRVVTKGGENALVAEPRWFESNPQAVILKNMIEKDGAPMGISITAIPSDHDEVERDGETVKRWTDGKIISADFVGIPANEHSRAMAIAKKFINPEVDTVDNEEIRKGFSEDVNTALGEAMKDISKASQLDTLDKKIDALTEIVKAQNEKIDALTKAPEPDNDSDDKGDDAGADDSDGEDDAAKAAKKAAIVKKALDIKKREEELAELKKKLPEATTGEKAKAKPDANAFIQKYIKR